LAALNENRKTGRRNGRHYIFGRWGRNDILLHDHLLDRRLRRFIVRVTDSFSIAHDRLSYRSIIADILKSTRFNFNIFLVYPFLSTKIRSSNSVKISLTL